MASLIPAWSTLHGKQPEEPPKQYLRHLSINPFLLNTSFYGGKKTLEKPVRACLCYRLSR